MADPAENGQGALRRPFRDWLARWWYRLTYCTRHGHHHTSYGFDGDDYCGNCGKDRR